MFSAHGPGILCHVKGIMNAVKYLEILQNNMIPSAHADIRLNFIFMHENDPKHTANIVKDWITTQTEHPPFTVLSWPAQSPDLNPIENLWAEVSKEVDKRGVTRLPELFGVVQQVWNNFSRETCERYVRTMPARLQEVLRNRGGHTHY